MRRSIVITKATTPAVVDDESVGLTGVAGALSAGSVAVSGAAWNLPATISVQQDGTVGLRQYALNAGAHTISVSGLPTGVTYNSGLEQLEGAATGTSSGTATFTLSRVGGSDVVDTATVALVEVSDIGTVAGNLFTDDFESARMDSATTLALPGNSWGLWWGGNQATSVCRVEDDGSAVAVWNNGVINNPLGSPPYSSISPRHVLRGRFTSSSYAEQKWYVPPENGVDELWMRLWMRVPSNYDHAPSSSSKFFLFGPYDNGSYQYQSGNQGALAFIKPSVQNGTIDWGYYVEQGGAGEATQIQYNSIPGVGFHPVNDRGVWFQYVFRLKHSSSAGVPDGILQMWQRRQNETSWTQMHNATNLLMNRTSGWCYGYIWSWPSNVFYSITTEWLADEVVFSTTDLR